MERVIVLGADGYIGNRLVHHLLDRRYIVHAFIMPGNRDMFEGDSKNLFLHEFDQYIRIWNVMSWSTWHGEVFLPDIRTI